jgi:hypothetical protein
MKSTFSPLKTSSPRSNNINQSKSRTKSTSSETNRSRLESNPYDIHQKKKKNLRIMALNCCSIKDKKTEFEMVVHYLKPDIICGTESWLKGVKPGKTSKDAIKSSEIFPENYNVYRNDRGTLGGGVFILVEKPITSIEQVELITEGEMEWVKVKTKNNKDITIGTFYMPHRQTKLLDELKESLDIINTKNPNSNIILTGDFNCPNMNWNQQTAFGQDREIQQELVDIISSNNLTQIHGQPTREGNLLDLVIVSNPTLVKSSVNVLCISDHDIIITDFETKVYHQKTKPRKCYFDSRANWDKINEDMGKLYNSIKDKKNEGNTIHQLWDTFKENLFETMNRYIPNRESRARSTTPWIKNKQRKMIKRKQRLYNKARKTIKWANYRHYQKECKRNLRKAEWEYINSNIIEGLINNNTKPFWKYVKYKRQDSGGIAPLKLILDSLWKAAILQDQFKSVFTKPISGESPTTRLKAKQNIND